MKLGLVSLLGIVLFAWPFLGLSGPPEAPALALAVGSAAALLILEVGTRNLDARRLTLLAVLAATATGLRLAVVHGIGGFNPMFFVVLCAGFAFGPSYGFLVGAISILVSALVEGGVGPWLPYQMFATGWVGVAAGLAAAAAGRLPGQPFRWGDVALLAGVGAGTGWLFGGLMDVTVWTAGYRGSPGAGWEPGLDPLTALARFGRFYLLTSLGYDSFRAVGNAVMVLLLGAPVLAALGRVRSRLSFEVVET